MTKHSKYDERQVAVLNRAWRRTCFLLVAGLVVTSIFLPEHSVGTQATVLTFLVMASQAAQGIWGGAYVRVDENPRSALAALVLLLGASGYTFIEYGITTGQWWGAGNPIRFVAFLLCLIVAAIAVVRWSVDRWGSASVPEKPKRWPRWDERQQAARDRAWRRTCIAVLVALWVVAAVSEVRNLPVPLVQLSVVLIWAAIGFHAAQAVWAGAYDRSGETSWAMIVAGCLFFFAYLGYVMYTASSDGRYFDFDHVVLVLPLIPLLSAILATLLRRWVDRRAAAE